MLGELGMDGVPLSVMLALLIFLGAGPAAGRDVTSVEQDERHGLKIIDKTAR